MQTDVERARHMRERGDILRTLKEDYRSEMTSLRSLLGALDAQGMSLAPEGLEFHLTYLEAQGYVRLWRAKDMPGYRRDRHGRNWQKPDAIQFAKLLPRGLQLIDGQVAEDPLVIF
jgi:hypothetical protein